MNKSNKIIKAFVLSSFIAYVIKFVVDVIMYMFMISRRGDYYYDLYYLIAPQAVATVLMVFYYTLFFRREFIGPVVKISTVILVLVNIAYIVFLYFYDKPHEYPYYFTATAVLNFLGALFLKCNIIPEEKTGQIEYIPIIFEITAFVAMAVSALSAFYGFPFIRVYTEINYTDVQYHDVQLAFKMNMFSEIILIILHALCLKNKCEFVRDNMFTEDQFE